MRRKIWTRRRLAAAAFVLAVVAGALGLRFTQTNIATAQTQLLTALQTDAAPGLNPDAAVWSAVEQVEVPLTTQNVTYPRGGSVPTVAVQAVHANGTLYVRAEWPDAAPNDAVFAVEQFADAVALEFPADAASAVPSVCMGQADAGVNIWYWRADGAPITASEAARPNAAVDEYPSFGADAADLAYPARAVGNPVALETGGVQNLVAQAFGSLTPAQDQAVTGGGSHKNGRWAVVLTRPFPGATPDQASFTVGTTTDMAVAVWDGANQDRNGQKAVSQFMRLAISEENAPGAAGGAVSGDDGVDLALLLGLAIGLPLFLIISLLAVSSYQRARQD